MSDYGLEELGPGDEAVRISGRVKWFDAGKGYGFIVPDDPNQTGLRDVLLHVTSLRNTGRESALEGSTIVCDVVKRPKGWQLDRKPSLLETSVPGVFAVGNVRHGSVKRVASAVGEGSVAIRLIHDYLRGD